MEAKKNGVNGYIRKPFSSVQLEAKLRVLMFRMSEKAA
jgi:DNA-binding response OmpR family regulator